MSAVLLAVFDQYGTADRVRTRLVRDGFPTDRVELTATSEPGRAGIEPGGSSHARFLQYFRTLMREPDEQPFVEALVSRVEEGAVAVAVHPRGTVETARATEILEDEGAVEVVAHDLANQSFERAAARTDGNWVRHFIPENTSGADCIYCRLFPGGHRH